LTQQEVQERIQAGQVNTLPPRSGRTTWDIVKTNVFTRINALLSILWIMVLVSLDWSDLTNLRSALFGVLVLYNSLIGMYQEFKARRILDSLTVVSEGKPKVRRDGVSVEIPREEIVLGDIIEIGPGDQIVVDGEVVEASYLELDESLLTGESDAVDKQVGDELMSGSHVVAGVGAFRATKVGTDSYAAKLTSEANKFSLTKSELQAGINVVLRLVTWLMIPVGIATIWVQWHEAGDWVEAFRRMTGALVPMVPEGLVALTSLAFLMGVVRLSKQNVLVQELPAIEGLARVDVVCADKTGTLTENGMKFAEIIQVGESGGYEEVLAQLAGSDPSPNASMKAIAEAFPPANEWQIDALAPFTSAKKWSGASFVGHGNWIMGAPDVLAPGSQAAAKAEEIGATGQRVLLLGSSDTVVDSELAPGVFTPEALVVLDQRVRPEAKATLDYFAKQGVQVKVISGDNAKSVGAVIKKLGITEQEVVDARELPTDPEAFADAVEAHNVFGRVTPEQKRQMVSALQSKGHNVAMTGDGVNDVLAIKDSDIGVAMGSGAPATRAVAQVVLLDDDFGHLPSVVAEGRRVIGNIERVANFFLTKTLYSIVLALLVAIWMLPFPFETIHITLVGWFTIGIPACIMSLAPNKERARPGFLGRVMRFGIPSGLVIAVATFISYMTVFPGGEAGLDLKLQASTAALTTLLMGGCWVMITTSRPYQWWKIVLLALCCGALVVIYMLPTVLPFTDGRPVGQWFFNLDPSNASMMTTAMMIGLVEIVLIEAVWWIDGLVGGVKRKVFALRGEDC
jgi:cation-transporting ATPase E